MLGKRLGHKPQKSADVREVRVFPPPTKYPAMITFGVSDAALTTRQGRKCAVKYGGRNEACNEAS